MQNVQKEAQFLSWPALVTWHFASLFLGMNSTQSCVSNDSVTRSKEKDACDEWLARATVNYFLLSVVLSLEVAVNFHAKRGSNIIEVCFSWSEYSVCAPSR